MDVLNYNAIEISSLLFLWRISLNSNIKWLKFWCLWFIHECTKSPPYSKHFKLHRIGNLTLNTKLSQCKHGLLILLGFLCSFTSSVPQHITVLKYCAISLCLRSSSMHPPCQTLCDRDDDCIAYPFAFIITISALAHISPAKCLLYTVYLIL